jgi:hypothetical protein
MEDPNISDSPVDLALSYGISQARAPGSTVWDVEEGSPLIFAPS